MATIWLPSIKIVVKNYLKVPKDKNNKWPDSGIYKYMPKVAKSKFWHF